MRQDSLAPHHLLETNDKYEVIWDLSYIHVMDNNERPMIVNAPGKIIVEGVKNGELQPSIIGLDSMSGDVIWQIKIGNAGDDIITNNNILYRGTSGTAEVQAYSVENGKLLWKTRLPWGHSVSDLYFAENKIFVYTNNDIFFILNEQGEILETIHTTDRMFLETDGVLYMEGAFSIKAVDLASRTELWHVKLDNDYYHAPIFENGTIFIDTSAVPPSVYSIDQSSGGVKWKVSQTISSKFVIQKGL
jgi:outer membrane protein assembly factor BamB